MSVSVKFKANNLDKLKRNVGDRRIWNFVWKLFIIVKLWLTKNCQQHQITWIWNGRKINATKWKQNIPNIKNIVRSKQQILENTCQSFSLLGYVNVLIVYLDIHLFIHSFVRLFDCLFIYFSLIYLSYYLFILFFF